MEVWECLLEIRYSRVGCVEHAYCTRNFRMTVDFFLYLIDNLNLHFPFEHAQVRLDSNIITNVTRMG